VEFRAKKEKTCLDDSTPAFKPSKRATTVPAHPAPGVETERVVTAVPAHAAPGAAPRTAGSRRRLEIAAMPTPGPPAAVSLPSVVTWWEGRRRRVVGTAPAAPKGKAKRSREVEAAPEPAPDAHGRRKSTRDRVQTQRLDPAAEAGSSRASPVQPEDVKNSAATENPQSEGKRKRTAPLRLSPDLAAPAAAATPMTPVTPTARACESSWPAAWRKLLDRAIPVPRECLPDGAEQGLMEPSYVQQMRGTRTRLYIGRPVRVLADGKWESGLLASVEEVSDGKRRVMLSSGNEMDFETSEKAGRLRYDDRACGKFAVGRHAQVMFDGGQWYVGVVAKLHVDTHGEPAAAVMLFEGTRDTQRASQRFAGTSPCDIALNAPPPPPAFPAAPFAHSVSPRRW